MKKLLTIALALFVAAGNVSAAKKKAAAKPSNKPVFTIVKEIPVTSMKDQNRSGTCWDYSTLSFFEAEILKATGKKYDLCESFIANKTYMDRAIQVVRYHGDCQFAQGGSSEDVLATLKAHGICPEEAMPFPGSLYGDSLNNFNEFFSVLEPYVAPVAKSSAKKISNAWKNGFQGILELVVVVVADQRVGRVVEVRAVGCDDLLAGQVLHLLVLRTQLPRPFERGHVLSHALVGEGARVGVRPVVECLLRREPFHPFA